MCAVILTACFSESYSWNQKITIVVETPIGEVSGSAVTKIDWRKNNLFKDGSSWQSKITGEAAFVDLGAGRYVFATISGTVTQNLGKNIVKSMPTQTENLLDSVSKLDESIIIPPKLYPTLLTFQNISDPKSAINITGRDFSELFGSGYKLKAIKFEITDEKITQGKVTEILKWLQTSGNANEEENMLPYGFSRWSFVSIKND